MLMVPINNLDNINDICIDVYTLHDQHFATYHSWLYCIHICYFSFENVDQCADFCFPLKLESRFQQIKSKIEMFCESNLI